VGRLEPERLMRTLLVVLVPEPVKRALLGADVAFGVLGELGQRTVEALLAAVLLRFPRRDAVVPDPRRCHHTDSAVRPPAPVDANGGPLSERMASGVPNSWKAESKIGSTLRVSGSTSASQRSR